MLLNDMAQTALVGPSYNVYKYNNNLYKVVHFPRPRLSLGFPEGVDRSKKGNDRKLDPSISRARKSVLELALCNPWDWFGTFTLNKEKYDRNDLDKFREDFTQWIRDQRKATGAPIRFLLVPEMHQDGAWHMHGLLYGLPSVVPFADLREQGWRIPDKLIAGDYSCWLGYHSKFGFCSLGAIRDPVRCAFYVSKYVSKDMDGGGVSVGKHLYFASRPLDRSTLHGQVFEQCAELSALCTNKYEFCSTGFVRVDDPYHWDFALESLDGFRFSGGPAVDWFDDSEDPSEYKPWFLMQEGIQEAMEGFS